MIEALISAFLSALGEILEFLIQLILDNISFDINQFQTDFPVAGTMYTILQGVAFGIIFGIGIFQLVKFFTGPLSQSTETPLRIGVRCIIASACVLLGNYGLVAVCNLFSYPYADLSAVDGVDFGSTWGSSGVSSLISTLSSGDLSCFSDHAAAELNSFAMLFLSFIVLILLGWNLFKLILEVVERYLVLMTIIYTSPLGWATIASEATEGMFKKWLNMFFSQCVMMLLNVWSFKIVLSIFGTGGEGATFSFLRLIIGLAFCKVAQRMDTYLNQIGANPALTGQDMLDDFVAVSKFARAVTSMTDAAKGHGRALGSKMGNSSNFFNNSSGSNNNGSAQNGSASHGAGNNFGGFSPNGGTAFGPNSGGNATAGNNMNTGFATGDPSEAGRNPVGADDGTNPGMSFDSFMTGHGQTATGEQHGTPMGGADDNFAANSAKSSAGEAKGKHSPATMLTPEQQAIMRTAMAQNGGKVPSRDELAAVERQASKLNYDLNNAGLHMDNGTIQPNGRSTGTHDVSEFVKKNAGVSPFGDHAIASTIANGGEFGKALARDAILNNPNSIRSATVGAATAAAILNSAKGGLNSQLNGIPGAGENHLNGAVAGGNMNSAGGLNNINALHGTNAALPTGHTSDMATGVGNGIDGTALVRNGSQAGSGNINVSPDMDVNQNASVANVAGAGAEVQKTAHANTGMSNGGEVDVHQTDANNGSPDSVSVPNAGTVDTASSATSDVSSSASGVGVTTSTQNASGYESGAGQISTDGNAVDYEQFTTALNATAAGSATPETGSVSDLISGNGQIVGTYNPPAQQEQATDPQTGSPLFNADGSPQMRFAPVSNPQKFSIMSNEAWNKLPEDARAGYKSFTTEGGQEFRIKMAEAKIAGNNHHDHASAYTGNTLGSNSGSGKNRDNRGRHSRRGKK